jgi:thiol-disulfide isomerase/thioredoxin
MNKEKRKSGFKRFVLEWLGIGAVIALLYVTGLHTEVLGTMQRAMLWTGLFDAERTEIKTSDGPFLSEDDYNFSVINAEGQPISFKDLKGKVLFVNVWASWCPPCVAEMPTIETLYSAVSPNENIQFIMLSLDQEREKAVEFMESRKFTLPYHFPASPLPGIFRTPYLPTTYVVSKKGQVIYKKEGIADYSSPEFRDWLLELSRKD